MNLSRPPLRSWAAFRDLRGHRAGDLLSETNLNVTRTDDRVLVQRTAAAPRYRARPRGGIGPNRELAYVSGRRVRVTSCRVPGPGREPN